LAELEQEMGIEDRLLQHCVKLLSCWANLEEEDEDADVRTANVLARIYSPSTPQYVDLHFQYHCRERMSGMVEWYHSMGYKLYSQPSPDPPNIGTIKDEVPFSGVSVKKMHHQADWQPIFWAQYKGGPRSRAEECSFNMKKDAVIELCEVLFGPGPPKPKKATEATKIEQRRRLVRTVRTLLAAVGIDYQVACVPEENDVPPDSSSGIRWVLEGNVKGDKWIARRIRKVCGFQFPGGR